MGIYVEILIRGDIDELWEKTQNPKLHERWDLRFSDIEYLPRKPEEPQKFLYATRIGAGMRIEGAGESTGERSDSTGQRTSALKFWSEDPKSLIKTGAGYWKYVPTANGIRFFTFYDYQTRFGTIGKTIDRLFFRPAIGWATAWSFDCFRLWIEQGIPPEVSRTQALTYCLSRFAVAFIWLYHGLIPKLIYHNADEIRLLQDAGISSSMLGTVMSLVGWAEVFLALVLVIFWRARWPVWLTIVAMFAATLCVSITSPSYLSAAFNPVSLNLAMITLSLIAVLTRRNLPSAGTCRRKPVGVKG
jgi:hypothetical protein